MAFEISGSASGTAGIAAELIDRGAISTTTSPPLLTGARFMLRQVGE
jgi:hypothetical protein